METPLTFLLLIVIGFVSFLAFREPLLHARLTFDSRAVRERRELPRFVTSAFVHLDVPHLLMNLVAILFFGPSLERMLGPGPLLLVFLGGSVAGNLASLATHRGSFRGAGASAGGAAIIFACVLLSPFTGIRPLLLPVPLDAWVWGAVYLGASMYAMVRRDDGIGHDAHIGGALGGLALAAAFRPGAAIDHAWVFLLLLGVMAGVRIVLFPPGILRGRMRSSPPGLRTARAPRRPGGTSRRRTPRPTGSPSPRAEAILEEARAIDAILEKISTRGLDSLSPHERKALERFSERRRARRPSTST